MNTIAARHTLGTTSLGMPTLQPAVSLAPVTEEPVEDIFSLTAADRPHIVLPPYAELERNQQPATKVSSWKKAATFIATSSAGLLTSAVARAEEPAAKVSNKVGEIIPVMLEDVTVTGTELLLRGIPAGLVLFGGFRGALIVREKTQQYIEKRTLAGTISERNTTWINRGGAAAQAILVGGSVYVALTAFGVDLQELKIGLSGFTAAAAIGSRTFFSDLLTGWYTRTFGEHNAAEYITCKDGSKGWISEIGVMRTTLVNWKYTEDYLLSLSEEDIKKLKSELSIKEVIALEEESKVKVTFTYIPTTELGNHSSEDDNLRAPQLLVENLVRDVKRKNIERVNGVS